MIDTQDLRNLMNEDVNKYVAGIKIYRWPLVFNVLKLL